MDKINVKAALGAAGAGFFLAFLTGLISGNSFGSLLLRSLVSGAALGVVFVLCYLVLLKYIPELFEELEDEESQAGEAAGGKVNIVMPSEEYSVQGNMHNIQKTAEGLQTESGVSEQVFEEVGLENLKEMGAGVSASSVGTLPKEATAPESVPSEISLDDNTLVPTISDEEIEVMGQKHSPEVLAQAVKTAMKRD